MKTAQSGIFFTILLMSLSLSGLGQKYQVEGTIRDNDSREPIPAASIILKNTGRGTTSNEFGAFRMEVNTFPSVLFIQCMGFVRDTLVIANLEKYVSDYKNQNKTILLKKSTIRIDEVQVKARSTLFEKDPYAIVDFNIVGKRIVALGYKYGNEFRKEVLLADLSGKMLSNHTYKNLDSIYQDCQGNLFAFCKDSVLELGIERRDIQIINKYGSKFICDYLVPVCGLSDSLIFLKKSSQHHQYDNYFAISDNQSSILVYSTGGMMKEAMVSGLMKTWRYLAATPVTIKDPPAFATSGIQYRIFFDNYDRLHKKGFDIQHDLQVDYRPVFTKMISYGQFNLIIDREAATIFWFDLTGDIISEVGINNKMNGLFFQDIHIDRGNSKIYFEYPQGLYTHFIEINPTTGEEIRRFMVQDYRHIEKCTFLGDRLFFLHQPETGLKIKKVVSIWI